MEFDSIRCIEALVLNEEVNFQLPEFEDTAIYDIIANDAAELDTEVSVSALDHRNEVLQLFDTRTVPTDQILKKTRISTTLVKKPKVVFVDGGRRIEVIEEAYLSFTEVPCEEDGVLGVDASKTALDLHILRGCARENGAAEGLPVMPSLRLEALRKGYKEPVRDRSKDWQLDSQREVLNSCNIEELSLPPLGMGKYDFEKRAAAPLLWSPAMQALVRKKLLSRIPYTVSETSCLIDVYGIGINGRVYSEGSAANRLLVLNVYSIWNCEMHTMTLTGAQLRSLFTSSNKEDKLKAGMRPELLHEIIGMLYFQYSVTVTPEPGDEDFGSVRERIYEARHLDDPKLPFDFPQTIEEIIRELSLAEGVVSTSAKCPTSLRQELRIALERQETVREKHLRDAADRARRAVEDAEKGRLAWLAIPKRRRGLEATRPFRMWGRMIVLTAYRVPQKLIVSTVTGYFPNDCLTTEVILSMKDTGKLYGVGGSVRSWPHPVVRALLRKALKDVKLRNTGFEDFFCLNLFSINGPQLSLPDLPDSLPSFTGNMRRIKERDRSTDLNYRPSRGIIGGQFDGFSRACSHLRRSYFNLPTCEPTHYRVIRSRATALSAASTRINPRYMNELQWTEVEENTIRELKLKYEKSASSSGLGDDGKKEVTEEMEADPSAAEEVYVEIESEAIRRDAPRRMDVGRGVRVASRAMKIGRTYCIYTMYLDKMYPGFPPQTWEEDKEHLQPLDVRSRKSVSAFVKKRPKKVLPEEEITGEGGGAEGASDTVEKKGGGNEEGEDEEEEDEFRFSEDEEEEEEEEDQGSEEGGEVDALEKMRRDMAGGGLLDQSSVTDTDTSDITGNGNNGNKAIRASVSGVAVPGLSGEEADPYDQLNHLFETAAPGVSISIDIFLPFGAELEDCVLPEATTLRLQLTKEDLYRAVAKHKYLIYVGFRAAYTGFYSRASEEETEEVERVWSIVAEEVMRSCRWTVRRPVTPKPVLEATDGDTEEAAAVQRYNNAVMERNAQLMSYLCSMDTVDVTSEKYDGITHREDYDPELQAMLNPSMSIEAIRKAERKSKAIEVDVELEEEQEDLAFMREIEQLESEFSEQATLTSLATSSLAMKSVVSVEKPSVPDVPTLEEPRLVLTWPTVTFRRVMRVQSVVEGEVDPLLQIIVWQKGNCMGLVGVNRKRREIMFAQASEGQQAAQVQANRFLSASERAVGLFIYLNIELCYSVVMESQTGRAHGSIDLVQADDQSLTFEIAEDDLMDLTADAMKVGGNKMRTASRH